MCTAVAPHTPRTALIVLTPHTLPHPPSPLLKVPGIEQLSAAQFSEILVSIADLAPGDYALGLTKMFLKAGKGKFLEDLKDKPVDEARSSSSSSRSSCSYTYVPFYHGCTHHELYSPRLYLLW